MKVLVACERSQVVTTAFREHGHEAFSCDIEEAYGGHPEWHIQAEAVEVVFDPVWELIIAHPPCRHLCVSGARYWREKQADLLQQCAIDFFMMFTQLPCNKVAIENPVGIMSKVWRKPDQYIQPWQFGHYESKKTGLWLKNLPLITPTNVLLPRGFRRGARGNLLPLWDNQTRSGQNKLPPSDKRAQLRAETYKGIADAMAIQWGGVM